MERVLAECVGESSAQPNAIGGVSSAFVRPVMQSIGDGLGMGQFHVTGEDELLRPNAELDPAGSLVDADMGSYYTYLNQQRLAGAEKSSFLVWFEGHNEAVAIGPTMPRGTQSSSPTDLRQLLTWLS